MFTHIIAFRNLLLSLYAHLSDCKRVCSGVPVCSPAPAK
jgi:hypothetical protein